jgi:glutathione synthase/RimK-type ligase-like ATP-grasp enzyme
VSIYLLRRRKLGRTSCREMAKLSKTGIRVFRSDVNSHLENLRESPSLVFRWGCTDSIPEGIKVVNDSASIHKVNDKRGFRKVLGTSNLCPKTWTELDQVGEITFPCVVRKAHHHQGRGLHFCRDKYQLARAMQICQGGYVSAFVDKVAEYRVFLVSGRVVCVARKHPNSTNGVAWNVAQGGRFENVSWENWPLKAVKASVKAFDLSDLDFGGVDVMVDREGNPTILEINSAPSLTSPYRQACFAKAFDWIVSKGKAKIPLIEEKGGYLKFIHPAVSEDAKVGMGA